MPMLPNYGKGPGEMDIVGSHQRCLVGSVLKTQGTILELGVGWYSTPILHELAEGLQRKLVTLDNNRDWFRQFENLESEYHHLQLLGWWGDMVLEPHYGLVFVDQGQPIEREYAIRRLVDRVDVFVLHDTEEGFAYGYNRILGTRQHSPNVHYDLVAEKGWFKYLYTDRCQAAWTTVASNKYDVSKWFKELPPVAPSQEVT